MKKYLLGLVMLSATSWLQAQVLGGMDIPNLSSPDCQAIDYKAVDIYNFPRGQVVGQIILDRPELAKTAQPYCSERTVMQLQKANQPATPIDTVEISYEHPAPAVYETRHLSGEDWFKLRAQDQVFWIKGQKAWKYLSYEQDLVQGIETVVETCTLSGRCQAVDPAVQQMVKNVERSDTCYDNLYDITGPVVRLANGRNAYPVKMAPELVAKYGKYLPEKTFIPTYTRAGQWTGFFFSRGC